MKGARLAFAILLAAAVASAVLLSLGGRAEEAPRRLPTGAGDAGAPAIAPPASSSAASEAAGAIAGLVAHLETGEGVAGVEVTARLGERTWRTATAADGAFLLDGLPPGDDYLLAAARGPLGRADRPGVRVAPFRETFAGTLFLAPPAILTVLVTDVGGRPLEGAVARAFAVSGPEGDEPAPPRALVAAREATTGATPRARGRVQRLRAPPDPE